MLMGRVVRGERYSSEEYGTAMTLAIGVSVFFLANGENAWSTVDRATTMAGVVLMSGYLAFDAFTLNWQKALFDKHRISKWQVGDCAQGSAFCR